MMQASCNIKLNEKQPSIVDEIKEDELSERKLDVPQEKPRKKSIPKPLTIENKQHNLFPNNNSNNKKSPHSGLLDVKEPISPNRSILFFDFLKSKFGEAKTGQVMVIIEKYQAENKMDKKISREDYEKIRELIGESDANYIVKFLRFVLKLTPKGENAFGGEVKKKFEFGGSPKDGNGETLLRPMGKK